MFQSYATLAQYLKHLRWAHRFLHYTNSWDTATLKQTTNGVRKSGCAFRMKLALLSKQVSMIVTKFKFPGVRFEFSLEMGGCALSCRRTSRNFFS